jgi:hypothetical protein
MLLPVVGKSISQNLMRVLILPYQVTYPVHVHAASTSTFTQTWSIPVIKNTNVSYMYNEIILTLLPFQLEQNVIKILKQK